MNPKKFLFRLGIKNHSGSDSEPSDFQVDPASDDDLKFDPMAAQYMEALFPTETAAQSVLGRNYKRLESSMKRLQKSAAFGAEQAGLVAELGGGAGVLGMWLAECKLTRECKIYDYAENPLAIGREWAKKLSLSEVSFHRLSYADISDQSPTKDCDFVFCEHGVELNRYLDIWDEHDKESQDCHAFFRRRYNQLAGAIFSLMKDSGLALVGSGTATPWALELLCEALRQRQLMIDWHLTSNRDGLQLYLRKSGMTLLSSHHEDALALVNDMKAPRTLECFEIPSQQRLFSDGHTYLEIRFHVGEEAGEIIIKQKAGLALYTERGTHGHESAKLSSAGHIATLVQLGLAVISKTTDCVVTHRFIDPRVDDNTGGITAE